MSLFPPVRPSRRRRQPTIWSHQLWITLAAVLVIGVVTGLGSLAPVVAGWLRWTYGAGLAAVVIALAFFFLSPERGATRAVRYALIGPAVWIGGFLAGFAMDSSLSQTLHPRPIPDGSAIERAYWNHRLQPLEAYATDMHARYPNSAFNATGMGVDLPNARTRLAEARAALARARTAEAEARQNTAVTAAQLEALGRNRFEKQLLRVTFSNRAAEADAAVAQLWAQETARLDGVATCLNLLDQWRGHWSVDRWGLSFRRPDDTRSYDFALDRIRVAELRIRELQAQLGTLRGRTATMELRRSVDH